MVCIDDPHEVLMGFSKNSFLDPYDDLERQQTSLRAPQNNFSYELQQPPWKTSPRDIYPSGLLVAPLNMPHLL